MNAVYELPVSGFITVKATYEPGTDTVLEVGRKLSWSGQLSGKCLDCGKDLYYGYANAPKFIKRRLMKLEGTLKRHPYAEHRDGEYDSMEVIDPGKQQGVDNDRKELHEDAEQDG